MNRSKLCLTFALALGLGLTLALIVPGGAPPTLARTQPTDLVAPALSKASEPVPDPDISISRSVVSDTLPQKAPMLDGPPDAQSTTGPTPPPGVNVLGALAISQAAVVIPDVPAYHWHHGCGPTAAGMVIGYWDTQGFDDLVAGDASTQTDAVNIMIASEGPASNYTDYCEPIDSPPILSPDKSEPPFGDEHPDDCVADYMKTSQSYHHNYYGWSWFSDVGSAMKNYVDALGRDDYHVSVSNLYWGSSLNWDSFRTEIDDGRPLVLLVDTNGDGGTDHFVTAIGYDVVGGQRYASLNTWDTDIHWFDFAPMASGQPWGIFGAVTATFVEEPPPTGVCEDFESFTVGSNVGSHDDWYDGGGGPVVTAGNGVAGSIGLGPASSIFTWVAHPFDWNAPDFLGVNLQMDFKTDASGHFDDDRMGWMITDSSSSSANIFGVQMDPGGGGYNIEGYWDGVSADNKGPSIVDLPSLPADTWYRFRAEITKLTATSASIDVTLTELDASGNPGAVVASGSIPDTSALGDDAPNSKYFTGPIWPAYKNYTAAGAPADNACFEIGAYEAQPNLSIDKTAVPTTGVAYRGVVTYTVVLGNSGAGHGTGVLLTDTLPSEVDFASWVEQPAGANVAGDEITWNGTVTASTAITFTFVVTHTGDYGDVVTNTVEYSHASGGGSDDATFTVEFTIPVYLPIILKGA